MSKLTFLLSLAFMQVSAAGYSQGKVSVNFRHVGVEKVFHYLEKKSAYVFYYNNDELEGLPFISLELKDVTVPQVLDSISNALSLHYNIMDNKLVVIQKGDRPFPIRQVHGRVVDKSGAALAGVTVKVKGTNTGTATDAGGNFVIDVPDRATLVFSYVGFDTKEVAVNGQSDITVTMAVSATGLNEVVVIGYGTQKRKDLTGAISTVSGSDIARVNVPRIDQALQGQTSGVQITNNSSRPGGDVAIRIRGGNSLNGSNDPLVVIDGIIGGNLSLINPQDIQSIDILKDASATAIYGSRGANGVIIVTTKHGTAGPTSVDLNVSYGVQTIRKKLDLLNASQQYDLLSRIARLSPYSYLQDVLDKVDHSVNTDWQDEVFTRAPIQSYELAIRGGNEKTTFALSGNLFKQGGIIKNSDFTRGTFRLNLDHHVNDWLETGVNLSAARSITDLIKENTPGGSGGGSITQAANRMSPMLPVYDSAGDYSGPLLPGDQLDNPVALIHERTDKDKINYLQGNFFAKADITRQLIFKTNVAYTLQDDLEQAYISKKLLEAFGQGSATVTNSHSQDWLFENTLTYHNLFGGIHDLTVLGGFTLQGYNYFRSSENGKGFSTEVNNFYSMQQAATTSIESSANDYRLASFLGRINYILMGKYLFTVSFRADGASKFAVNNKWAYFPSAAFSWRISDENFMQNVRFINNLKLRTSWGQTGSQAISPYQSLASFSTHPNNYAWGNEEVIGVSAGRVPNQNLRWETTAQSDIGLDASLFNSRLDLTADYYIKKTTNLLYNRNLPWYTGYSSQIDNIGSIQNKGFEFQATSHNLVQQFRWSTTFNISFNRNKVRSLGGDRYFYTNGSGNALGSGYSTTGIVEVGKPLGVFYGYVFDGIYQNQHEVEALQQPGAAPGAVRFKDLNGDHVIDDSDRTIIGNANPDFIWGLTNNFSYKGFDLSILVQSSEGNDILNLNRVKLQSTTPGSLSSIDNNLTSVLKYWHGEGTSSTMQGLGQSVGAMSSRFVEDGSYIRIKNITLGYNLSDKALEHIGIRRLRIYFTAYEPLTFTGYTGYDPEINSRNGNILLGYDYGGYPTYKSYSLGLNLTF